MRHDVHDGKLLFQYQVRPCFLDVHGGTIAAQNLLFVNADGGRRKLNARDGVIGGDQ